MERDKIAAQQRQQLAEQQAQLHMALENETAAMAEADIRAASEERAKAAVAEEVARLRLELERVQEESDAHLAGIEQQIAEREAETRRLRAESERLVLLIEQRSQDFEQPSSSCFVWLREILPLMQARHEDHRKEGTTAEQEHALLVNGEAATSDTAAMSEEDQSRATLATPSAATPKGSSALTPEATDALSTAIEQVMLEMNGVVDVTEEEIMSKVNARAAQLIAQAQADNEAVAAAGVGVYTSSEVEYAPGSTSARKSFGEKSRRTPLYAPAESAQAPLPHQPNSISAPPEASNAPNRLPPVAVEVLNLALDQVLAEGHDGSEEELMDKVNTRAVELLAIHSSPRAKSAQA